MSDNFATQGDVAAGFAEPHKYTVWEDMQGYLFGLVLAVLLTAASFYVVYTHLIWAPAIPITLVVLAVAQIGVHLVFFLHLTTAPDNTNNVLALAFGGAFYAACSASTCSGMCLTSSGWRCSRSSI